MFVSLGKRLSKRLAGLVKVARFVKLFRLVNRQLRRFPAEVRPKRRVAAHGPAEERQSGPPRPAASTSFLTIHRRHHVREVHAHRGFLLFIRRQRLCKEWRENIPFRQRLLDGLGLPVHPRFDGPDQRLSREQQEIGFIALIEGRGALSKVARGCVSSSRHPENLVVSGSSR